MFTQWDAISINVILMYEMNDILCLVTESFNDNFYTSG